MLRISKRSGYVATRALGSSRLVAFRAYATKDSSTLNAATKQVAAVGANAIADVVKDQATKSSEPEPPPPPPPPPKRRGFLSRLFVWTVVFSGLGYGGSVVYSLQNDNYRDFFTDSFPFAEEAVSFLEDRTRTTTLPWDTPRPQKHGSGMIRETADAASQAAKITADNAKEKFNESTDSARKALDHAKDSAEKKAADAKARVQKEADKLKGKAQGAAQSVKGKVESSSQKASDKAKQASDKASDAVDKAKANAKELKDAAKEKARKVQQGVKDVESATKDKAQKAKQDVKDAAASTKEKVTSAAKSTTKTDAPVTAVKPKPIPIDFKAADGPDQPPPQIPPSETSIPHAPLPEERPKILTIDSEDKLKEPVLVNLAHTINQLVGLLNEANVPATAQSVVEDAKKELNDLNDRIIKIKEDDDRELEKSLNDMAKQYSELLKAKDMEVREAFTEQEERWMSQLDLEREKLSDEYRNKLDEEMQKASEQMQHKLKEELVDQGIEMQRRWIREIKLRVEEERGGRLGRLDELTKGLKNLERVTLDNSDSLDSSIRAHSLRSAVAALKAAIDAPTRKSFETQLRAVKNCGGDGELIAAALSSIPQKVAEQGVPSFPELLHRFENVREQVRRVALVPEEETGRAGVLSHLTSNLLSSVMFRKHGPVKGDDVESILARTDHYLSENDLDRATRELNQLRGWPRKLAKDWIKDARARLEVKQAVDTIETKATLDALSSIA